MKFRQAKKLLKKRRQVIDVKGPTTDQQKRNRLAPQISMYVKYPPRYQYKKVGQAMTRKIYATVPRMMKKGMRAGMLPYQAMNFAISKYHIPVKVEK